MVFSDEQLMLLFGRGRRDAFDELYHRHANRLFGYVRKMTAGQEVEVEDLVQEIFIRVAKAAPNYKATAKFSTWLYRVATNTCLNALDRKKRHPHLRVIKGSTENKSRSGCPASVLELAEGKVALNKAMKTLPNKQRAVFVLRQVEELSYEEIAAALELPLGTVKTHLHRARAQLARSLSDFLGNNSSTIAKGQK